MPVRKRSIVKIDEDKCNGCGLCVPKCAEGALQIIDGKAKLVSEVYCDGLGACLGECPQDAITIEERQAEEFDEKATNEYLKKIGREPLPHHEHKSEAPKTAGHACPGSMAQSLNPATDKKSDNAPGGFVCPGSAARAFGNQQESKTAEDEPRMAMKSELANWPLQLSLVPTGAPYFQGAKLLIAADCAPFAYPDFHGSLLKGKTLVICCPKLDDVSFYREKLVEIFRDNDIASIEVAHMEVPCCFGLRQLVQAAIADSGRDIPFGYTVLGIRGDIIEEVEPQ